LSAFDGDSGDSFRSLILQLRGRIGLTQRDLAARLEVHAHSVQAWEAGTSYPGAGSLRALIAAAVQAGGFTPGNEAAEAARIWAAASRESSRLRTPFDRTWFDGLLSPARSSSDPRPAAEPSPAAPTPARAAETRRQSWGEAPDVASFVGRTEERSLLRRWVLDDRCRVAGLYGLGGIGKTLLAARLAQEVAPHFEYVYWRSLRDAPAPGEWLAGALGFLAPDDAPISGEAAQAMRLLDLLSQNRCLLVLDNFETVLPDTRPVGGASVGSDSYTSLLRQLGEVPHQSCLVLTSREAPSQLEVMRGERSPVRSMNLAGLSVEDGQTMLGDKRLEGDTEEWQSLIERCGGNGLALKVTGETIRDLFGGSISAYLEFAASTPGLMIGGLRQLLATQIERLSEVERDLLRWLAVAREPVSFPELAAELGPRTGRGATLEAIEGLRRRSLLERGERQARFTLHPVVLEYVTEQLIEEIAEEIRTGDLSRVLAQPLMKATAHDYVRRSQERLIAAPLLDQLAATEGSPERVEQRLLARLDQMRGRRPGEQGYGPGNLVNLLRLLRGD
jgi:transcriptional regulator with XRE-family HTH domain